MSDLIQLATDFLQQKYKKPIHTVAAALESKSGEVYVATNIDHFSGYVCAETAALAAAINADETKFTKIAAVRKETDGKISVVNPCGKCRQIFYDYCPGITIAVNDGGVIQTVSIEELLPFSFERQREKIQQVLTTENKAKII